MKHPFDIITEVASTSGTNAKLDILRANESNQLLQVVLKLCYDKSFNYYITKVPDVSVPVKASNSLEFAMKVLVDDLATRRVTGNAARDLLKQVMETLSQEDQQCIAWIIRGDVKAGIKDKAIAKVWPKLLPNHPYMRCSSSGDVTYPALSELKADGMFSRWYVKGNYTKANTRNGTPLIEIPVNLLAEMVSLEDGYYEGEVLVEREGVILSREEGNGIINSVLIQGKKQLEGTDRFVVQFWDYISEEDFHKGKSTVKRIDRLNALERSVSNDKELVRVTPYRIVNSRQEAIQHYSELVQEGYEGTILKNFGGIWKNGTSKDQIKMKVWKELDLKAKELIPANETSKNKDTFGSILFESECGKLQVAVTGFPDELRDEIHLYWTYYQGKVGTVKANALTKPNKVGIYSLFLPSFIEWRDKEKSEADTLDQIKEIFYGNQEGST